MKIGLLVGGMLVFAVIQISILRSFPKPIIKLFAALPLLGVLVNFFLSSVILFFTGIGNFVGMINMGSSVFVGIWLIGYKSFHKLEKPQLKFYRFFIPYLVIEEGNKEEHWLF